MKKTLFLLCFAIGLISQVFAHSGKPKHSVIIDTDGAIDDMRAISMLLSGNDIRVLGITCSQGNILPDSTYAKVKSLLNTYNNEGIPVGISPETSAELPPWAPFANSIKWGKSFNKGRKAITSDSLLNSVTKDYNNKLTLIALGSLKTYADWIKNNPVIIPEIERIIWYNNHNISKGFNYKISPESYELIKASGITLEIVSGDKNDFPANQEYVEQLSKYPSNTAQHIVDIYQQESVKRKTAEQHLKLWDDLVALYLIEPYQFEVKEKDSIKYIALDKNIQEGDVYQLIGRMLFSIMRPTNQVFTNFPTDPQLYRPTYANMVDLTTKNFGLIEWKAIVMTNEIHGHVGIYSIIGAKMGIRAMEYFNVGVNNMTVTTYSGHRPPKSCFNDGIQISTGCTIGQGLINIDDSISDIPSAIFEFNHQKIHVSLNPEISTRIKKDIKYGVKTYGLKSDEYWLYIEQLAIAYWSQYNRNNIFEIKKL